MSSPTTNARRLLAMLGPAGADHVAACDPAHWPGVLRLAEEHRVLPALGAVAIAGGLVAEMTDTFAQFVGARGRPEEPLVEIGLAHARNRQRAADMRSQLDAAMTQLAEHGIAVVPLKGAELLRMGAWPDPAAREMTDLDLLVLDSTQAQAAQEALMAAGYEEPSAAEYTVAHVLEDHHQLTPLRLPGHAGSIEVHRTLLPDEWEWAMPTAELVSRVELGPHGPRLSTLDLARHIITHACLNDRALTRHDLALRAVLDLGYLGARDRTLPAQLRAAAGSDLERRAIERMLAGVESIWRIRPTTPASARARWALARDLAEHATLHYLATNATLLPTYLDRERMSARAGRDLSGFDLQRYRITSTARRTVRAVRQIQEGERRVS